MNKPLNRIVVKAFHYPEPAYRPEQVFLGYLKANVTDVVHTEVGRRQKGNPYYPRIFVPFMIKEKEYLFADHFAFEAKDITPAYCGLKKRRWEFSYLNPPQREQERLQAILSTLKQNLEEIVEQARPLSGIPGVRSRRFLGQFPLPLREWIDERTFYGTLTKKPLLFFIHEHQLPSYAGEDRIPQGVLPGGLRPRTYLFPTYHFFR